MVLGIVRIVLRMTVASMLRWHLELRIEHLDVVPSLATATAVWEDTQHLLFDVWHFFESLETKSNNQMVHHFLPDLLRHVFNELLDRALDFFFDLHFLELVTTGLETASVIFIGILFLLLALQ